MAGHIFTPAPVFRPYTGLRRKEYLASMYDALIDAARYNKRFYEDFMNASVVDVGIYNGNITFKVRIRSDMEIYSIIMRQINRRIKGANVIIVDS